MGRKWSYRRDDTRRYNREAEEGVGHRLGGIRVCAGLGTQRSNVELDRAGPRFGGGFFVTGARPCRPSKGTARAGKRARRPLRRRGERPFISDTLRQKIGCAGPSARIVDGIPDGGRFSYSRASFPSSSWSAHSCSLWPRSSSALAIHLSRASLASRKHSRPCARRWSGKVSHAPVTMPEALGSASPCSSAPIRLSAAAPPCPNALRKSNPDLTLPINLSDGPQ
jgi:hypothetical protein